MSNEITENILDKIKENFVICLEDLIKKQLEETLDITNYKREQIAKKICSSLVLEEILQRVIDFSVNEVLGEDE